jgi:hypothetical protein
VELTLSQAQDITAAFKAMSIDPLTGKLMFPSIEEQQADDTDVKARPGSSLPYITDG